MPMTTHIKQLRVALGPDLRRWRRDRSSDGKCVRAQVWSEAPQSSIKGGAARDTERDCDAWPDLIARGGMHSP